MVTCECGNEVSAEDFADFGNMCGDCFATWLAEVEAANVEGAEYAAWERNRPFHEDRFDDTNADEIPF